MESISSDLTQLLVTEAVREMEKYFEKSNDKDFHIEAHIFEMGLKPGFAIASQLCSEGQDVLNIEEAGKFIATNLSQKLFNSRARYEVNKNVLVVQFKAPFPFWFKFLSNLDGKSSKSENFWFRSYASFFSGVFTGALTHFGFKSQASFSLSSTSELVFKFETLDLDGSWGFSSIMHH